MCDHCNSLWDKRDLYRDAEGLWTCPQEGKGRDGVTLDRLNRDHLKSFVERLRPIPEVTGRYGAIPVEQIEVITPAIMTESFLLMVTEERDPLVTESEVTLDIFGLEDGLTLITESGAYLEL